jgi:hypothetical protein
MKTLMVRLLLACMLFAAPVVSQVTDLPSMKGLPGKSLKKSNGTTSYVVDYWPILWSWYIDVAYMDSQSRAFYAYPKNGNGWEVEIMYEFQVAKDTSFHTIVFRDSMILDRYNFRKWPTLARKWLDTLGTKRPNPDTTYWVMRDSSWVVYGTTYYSRVNMRWFMFKDYNWWWACSYDPINKMYVWNSLPGGWSNTITFTMERPLPVELVQFDAVQEGSHVKLYWKTYSETMCALYIIKRMNETGSWEVLGTVPGSGTTNYTKRYSFVDTQPLLYKKNLYQLAQLNSQGVTEDLWYTECTIHTALNTSYPNPAEVRITIPFVVTIAGNVTLNLYDMRGQLVKTILSGAYYVAGNHRVEVDVLQYSSGIYFTELLIGSVRDVRKIVVLK